MTMLFAIPICMDTSPKHGPADMAENPGEKQPARVDDPVLAVFLERLEPKLKKLGITKSRLAEEIGISRNAMSQFFRRERRPSTDILIKIANELSVSIDYLVGRTDDSKIEDLLQHQRVAELVHGFVELSPAEQESVMNFLISIQRAKQVGKEKALLSQKESNV